MEDTRYGNCCEACHHKKWGIGMYWRQWEHDCKDSLCVCHFPVDKGIPFPSDPIIQERVRRNECTECGTPMKQTDGNEHWGTFVTQCEHGKGLVFSSG